ncbi:uncharacterized protein [Physcomitrium patens]|uniref:Uncharacterized protein n=2 Tax=Physcomitrium patens TaxID=3218 RepID=A0A2K1L1Q5_PHYPA|nr:uncharacterized protein LOC112273911 isoform X1 [Physcomitrium patens]PNR59965.1 hypothetical protein PHYPA_002757 [Physcomitrium patens]|eukprot:XP_024358734.1 uncharacterized protein LOC112273911 isoform X1 [Physcomitrella patens]
MQQVKHIMCQAAKMSHVSYEAMKGSRCSRWQDYAREVWHLVKMMFLTSLLCATLLLLPLTTGRSKAGYVMGKNGTEHISPFLALLDKGQPSRVQILETDSDIMKMINGHSTLELKTVVIAETVVPFDERNLLIEYVKRQLDASGVMSEEQKEAVLTMVDVGPMEALVTKEEIGEKGTLSNSAFTALIKKHEENVHFMLIGVRAEPRLGWNWIPSSQRNAWNDVLSRVVADKVHKLLVEIIHP